MFDLFSMLFLDEISFSKKKEWTSLQEPIANLMASITTLDEEDQPKLLEAVDMLTTYISTHHVHLVLYNRRRESIFLICISHNFVFISVA